MNEAIVVAFITACATVISQVIINRKSKHEQDLKDAVRNQKLDDELDIIKKRLDEHNNYAKRFSEITISVTEIRKDIEYLKEHKSK